MNTPDYIKAAFGGGKISGNFKGTPDYITKAFSHLKTPIEQPQPTPPPTNQLNMTATSSVRIPQPTNNLMPTNLNGGILGATAARKQIDAQMAQSTAQTVANKPQVTIRPSTLADKTAKLLPNNYANYSENFNAKGEKAMGGYTPLGERLLSIPISAGNAISAPATALRSIIPMAKDKWGNVTNKPENGTKIDGYYSLMNMISDLSGKNVDKAIQSVPVVGGLADFLVNIAGDTLTDPTSLIGAQGIGDARQLFKIGKAGALEDALNSATSVKRAAELASASKLFNGSKAVLAANAVKSATPIIENGKRFDNVAERNLGEVAVQPSTALPNTLLPKVGNIANKVESAVTGAKGSVQGEKLPWQLTKDEFKSALGFNSKASDSVPVKDFENLFDVVGNHVIGKTGKNSIEDIANFYTDKYHLPSIKIRYDLPDDARGLARALIPEDKSKQFYIQFKKDTKFNATNISYLRHEIEHIKDSLDDFKTINIPDKLSADKYRNQPFYKSMTDYITGHHKNYKWFEPEYLQRSIIKQAIKDGEQISENVLKDYPDLANIAAKAENPSTVARTTAQVNGNGLVNNVLKPNANGTLPINTLDKIVSGNPTLLQNMKTALTPTAGRPKAILSDLYQRFVDVQNPTKAFSKATGAKLASENPYTMSMNASNSGGISNYILNEGLATKEGNTIAKSFNEIANEVPKNQQSLYEDYLLNKHNISRTAEGKPVFTTDINGNKVDIATSEKMVTQYEKDHPNFKTASGNLQNWWQSFTNEWGVKSGLIDEKTAQIMREKYPNYVPTYREFASIERASGVKGAKSEFVNQSNTLKKATGSDRNVISPMQSFTQLVQKMIKASKYNEVGQTVYNALKKDPEKLKAFAEIIPERDSFNLGNDLENGIDELSTQWQKAQSDLSKNNVVRVMVDGKPVHIQINDKSFLRALTGADQQPANALEKGFRKGTGVFKSLITGKNPLFAVTNIARDVPTYLVNSTERNPIKALGTLGKATKGVLTNSKEFQGYKAMGGGGGGFFKQDYANLGKKGGLISKIEKFNNATEQSPRFAEYLATKNKLGNTYDAKVQALFNANDVTTNFARHGDITKSVDSFVPYLNPSVQGLDKTIRQIVTHPVGTLAKGLVVVTLPTVALEAINWNNPNYQALDNRTKDNYFLIPNGLNKDANGQAKTFIKLPKSREFGILFGSLAERITRKAMGQPDAFKGFASSAATNIAPTNPLVSNFFTPAATLATGGNKDWAGRPIVPAALQNLSPKNQYDEKTSEIAKSLGNLTGMSPKQVDYLITSYTGVIGQLGLPLATKSSYSNNIGGNLLSPITRKFTSDPLYSNQIMQDFYDNLAKAKTAAADKNLSLGANNQATPEDTINSQFTSAQSKISALQKQINVLNSSNDLQKQTKISDLRNQMIQAATDANSLITGKLTPQQSLANSLSQFSATKTNKSDEIKQYVVQNPSVNAGALSSRFSIPITQSRDVIKSVKDSSAASTYSDSVKKYLGLSKADMLKYYKALDAQSKVLLDNQLSASGLNQYGNKK